MRIFVFLLVLGLSLGILFPPKTSFDSTIPAKCRHRCCVHVVNGAPCRSYPWNVFVANKCEGTCRYLPGVNARGTIDCENTCAVEVKKTGNTNPDFISPMDLKQTAKLWCESSDITSSDFNKDYYEETLNSIDSRYSTVISRLYKVMDKNYQKYTKYSAIYQILDIKFSDEEWYLINDATVGKDPTSLTLLQDGYNEMKEVCKKFTVQTPITFSEFGQHYNCNGDTNFYNRMNQYLYLRLFDMQITRVSEFISQRLSVLYGNVAYHIGLQFRHWFWTSEFWYHSSEASRYSGLATKYHTVHLKLLLIKLKINEAYVFSQRSLCF